MLADGLSICPHCEEPVLPGEHSRTVASTAGRQVWHGECLARLAIGSLAHVQRRCSCYVPGSTCLDPPEMTRRQAAQAALDELRRQQPLPMRLGDEDV